MKIEIEIPEGYMLDGYTVKPVPVPLFNWQPYQPYIFPQVPSQSRRSLTAGARSVSTRADGWWIVTELAAYRLLGWKSEGSAPGDENPFILPACDDLLRTDWCITRCAPCAWSGISAPAILGAGCPSCRQPWSEVIQ
jgi:hypothetical protein